jgi:hypothetical protein
MKSFLDFDDAGAGDDHPARGVTVGDIRAWHDAVLRAELALHECEAYLDSYVDVVDGSYGEPAPNRAMSLMGEVKEAIAAITTGKRDE